MLLRNVLIGRPRLLHRSFKRASVSPRSTLLRQQLEFCCLLCGWEVACRTCPFNWFNFDHTKYQRRHEVSSISTATIQQAMKTLGLSDEHDKVSFSQQQVKDAFRAKALKWHPDCNFEPTAASIFKDILAAYELLLAHTRS